MTNDFAAMAASLSTAELIAVHNYCARNLGIREVNKFADRATAEKRTRAIVSQIVDAERRPQPFGPVDPNSGQNVEAPPVQQEKTEAMSEVQEVAADPNALTFGEREGTKRKALIDVLVANRGEFVPVATIIRAVYGEAAKGDDATVTADFKGPLSMVMKGLTGMIEKNGLPVELQRQKAEDKSISYGLIDVSK